VGIACLLQSLQKSALSLRGRYGAKESDYGHRRLLRPRAKRPRGRAAKQRNELAPFHRQFLPCFEAEDSIAGDLPHCGISAPSMTALGHQRPVATPAAVAPCPLYPKSGQTADSLGMSA